MAWKCIKGVDQATHQIWRLAVEVGWSANPALGRLTHPWSADHPLGSADLSISSNQCALNSRRFPLTSRAYLHCWFAKNLQMNGRPTLQLSPTDLQLLLRVPTDIRSNSKPQDQPTFEIQWSATPPWVGRPTDLLHHI